MDEEKMTPAAPDAQAGQPAPDGAPDENEAKKTPEKPPHENIVTRFYDQLNIPVRTLDIAVVVLCALILFLLLFGNRIHLGF